MKSAGVFVTYGSLFAWTLDFVIELEENPINLR